jgi:hypothetical protein
MGHCNEIEGECPASDDVLLCSANKSAYCEQRQLERKNEGTEE